MAVGKALDYSQARPPLGKVKANGYSCIYRYVCSDAAEAGLPGKRLTPQERDQILNAGLDVGLHGEDNAGAAQAGYPRGRQQGQQWGDYAHDVLDAPLGMTIVAAVDYDTGGTYPPVVADYLHGVADGLGSDYKVGVYGSIYVVDAALAEGHAVHGVQTVAWSHGKVSSWAHLYQHGPAEFQGTDYNDILRVPHGSWLQTLGVDVPLTDADIPIIRKAVKAELDTGAGTGTNGTWAQTNQNLYNRTGDIINKLTALSASVSDDATKAQLDAAVQQIIAAVSGAPLGFDMTGVLTPKPPTP